MDELLDERAELTRPRYSALVTSVLSTTGAPGALVCTDLMPFSAAALDLCLSPPGWWDFEAEVEWARGALVCR